MERRNSSPEKYESQSDDGAEPKTTSKHQSFVSDSNEMPPSGAESEDDGQRVSTSDNNSNNHCNSYLSKSKHTAGCTATLSYVKNEDGQTVVINRQEMQNKPVLKFSVNAILGSDHGKNNVKSGEY